MAFSDTPTDWLENWSEDGTDITVPLATFPELTATEADASTGDIRKIVYAIMRKLVNKWYATDAADRPSNMKIKDTYSTNAEGNLVQRIQIEFITSQVAGSEVADEPA